jgi:hypothetical protein
VIHGLLMVPEVKTVLIRILRSHFLHFTIIFSCTF